MKKAIDFLKQRGLNPTMQGGAIVLDSGLIDKDYHAQLRDKAAAKNMADAKPMQQAKAVRKVVPAELNSTWDELDRSDKLQALKDSDYTAWAFLYRDKFNRFPVGFQGSADFDKVKLYDEAMREAKQSTAAKDLSDETDGDEKLKTAALPKELFMDYDQLDKAGTIEKVRDSNYTLYCVLYFNKYNTWPRDVATRVDHNVKETYWQALQANKLKQLQKMSWDDLMADDLTTELKRLDAECYKQKYYGKYGVYPKF